MTEMVTHCGAVQAETMDGSAVLVTEMVTCSIVVEAETKTWRSTHQVKRKRQVTACKDGMRNDKSQ